VYLGNGGNKPKLEVGHVRKEFEKNILCIKTELIVLKLLKGWCFYYGNYMSSDDRRFFRSGIGRGADFLTS
jgi:hypothetical protein